MDFWTNINLHKGQLKEAVIGTKTASPVAGQIAFENGVLSVYVEGTVNDWVDLGSSGDVAALDTRLTTAEGKITTAEGKITTLEGYVGTPSASADASGSVYARIAKNVADITAINSTIGADTSSGLRKLINDNTTAIGTNTTNIATNTSDIATLKGQVGTTDDAASASGTLYARVKQNAADISTNATAITTLNGKIETTVSSSDSKIPTSKAVQTYVSSAVSSVYRYKASVANYASLPTTGQVVGDVYNVVAADPTHGIKAGDNVAWDGSAWDVLGGTTDLSTYATKDYVDGKDADKVDKTTTVNGHALSGNVTVTASDVGLGNCNNTSDADKPISTATQAALDLKANATQLSDGSVTKVGTADVGSATQPIYLYGGVPTAITGSIANNTTGNAATATALETARTIGLSGVTATAASFDGTANISVEVTAVPASLVSGTLADGNIPSLNASKINDGVFDVARIPTLSASKISDFASTVNTTVSSIFKNDSFSDATVSGTNDNVYTFNTTRKAYGVMILDASGNQCFAGVQVGATSVTVEFTNVPSDIADYTLSYIIPTA